MTSKKNRDERIREAQANWAKLNKKWDSWRFSSTRPTEPTTIPSALSLADLGVEDSTVSDTVTALPQRMDAGSTAPPKSPVYTGTKVLGVAVMHKSNLVPIFSPTEAEEVAKMRR